MKYIAKPPRIRSERWNVNWCEEEYDEKSSITVHEDDKETFSGIYDANGNEMHRVLQPIGFINCD